MGSTQEFISIKVLGLLTAIICISYVNYSRNQIFGAELGDGHNMPMATIGDRIAMLAFKSAQVPTNKNVNLDFTLLDNKTGDNIQHTTYFVTISNANQRLFTETVHSHGGHILMEFVPSTIDRYRVNANFDTLSVSYVADFSGPIKVIGKIFSPENYTVSLEVTGVDFDNLFLASPLKFEFPVFIS
ncbi:MAG: hypothetical protein QN819_07175 [Nitrososphaeraceae archaeon]|nr:hypothetical protein [Nitrososphaeraceae archaeon]